MDKAVLDLDTDYLISSFRLTTATGMDNLLNDAISHHKSTRFLSARELTAADLWRIVKPLVRQVERADAVLIIDDSIEEKPYTDENALICRHFDHTRKASVKGINFLTALYQVGGISLPVTFELVTKTAMVIDRKSGNARRHRTLTKNERFRSMRTACVHHQLVFRYVLTDACYASSENMKFVVQNLKKALIMPVKANRKVALARLAKRRGNYQAVEVVELEVGAVQQIYVEEVSFPLLLTKQVFINEDRSTGTLYLVTNELALDSAGITGLYQKRWKVEEYHKSLKQNASLAKSQQSPQKGGEKQ